MSIGKAISAGYFPFGVSTVSSKVHNALSQYVHVQTYNGHPGGCAAALETIAILEEGDLLAKATKNGAYFLERMQRLRELSPLYEMALEGIDLSTVKWQQDH